ncbi:MAG TPA: TMEM175 family protein [Thermomonas sp.]|jgi:hypothetical protein|uniref:TMEM175 family protein n=1 Tax=Thermomonas sp. TaxID=1971895 RepID=UPI002B8658CD|nr:TMEM175 family protein [Thermomonas sp.]HOV96721.1 TMEM175 family protein [Thermomonas sp.]
MELSHLRVEDGFRLRGEDVSRLETFVDAGFAFSMTMLVIFYNQLPDTAAELRDALRKVPSFVLCFILLAEFWNAHNVWSRRYGLEDRASTVTSLAFLMVVLIWIYPLRMVISSGLSLISGGWLPSELGMDRAHWLLDLQTVFMIYGAGYGLLSWLLWRLNAHALRCADTLALDAVERHSTVTEIGLHGIRTGAAAVSLTLSLGLLLVPQDWLGSSPLLRVLVASLPMWVYALMGAQLGRYSGKRRRERAALQAGAGA